MVEPLRVVITGASSGIGRALAVEYARRGAKLALIARRRGLLDQLAASSLPVGSHIYAVDVRDGSALADCAAQFIRDAGCPHIVIANAGVSGGTSTADPADNPVFEEIMSINVNGMMLTFQPFVEPMRAAGRGTLVGISSVAGLRGLPGAAAYSASKAAAIAYLESLRVELHGSGVDVVTVCPGYIDTPMTAVNQYRMPFLMNVDTAAKRIAQAIARGSRFHVLPWQMAAVAWLLRRIPRPLYDRILSAAPRKPRRSAR